MEKLTAGTNVSTLDFDAASLGTTVYRITLQVLDGAELTAKVNDVKLIKADGTEVSGNVSIGWGCSVTSESVPINTAIQRIQSTTPDSDDALYDLSGRRITASPRPGVYIRNKRVVVVK